MFNKIYNFFSNLFERHEITKIERQLKLIQCNPFRIMFSENPSEKMQLALIEQDPANISLIRHPTLAVQLEAIKENPYAILCVKDKHPDAIEAACSRVETSALRDHFEKIKKQKESNL